MAGKGFDEEIINEIHEVCKDLSRGVPWLVAGPKKEEFEKELVDKKPPRLEEYGPMVAKATKQALLQVKTEGKGNDDGIHYWTLRSTLSTDFAGLESV